MIAALDIACGFCGARKGRPCKTRHGRPMRGTHLARSSEVGRLNAVERVAAFVAADREARAAEEQRMPAPLAHRVQTMSYVWCDQHGELHDWDRDPYDYGHDDCDPIDWRRVYIETADENETF